MAAARQSRLRGKNEFCLSSGRLGRQRAGLNDYVQSRYQRSDIQESPASILSISAVFRGTTL